MGLSPDEARLLGRRVAAYVIDVFLVVLLFFAVAASAGNAHVFEGMKIGDPESLVVAGTILVYFFLLEASTGRTIGKLALGLEVRTVDGKALGPAAALIRNVLRLVDQLPVLYAVGLATIITTKRRQRLGDLAARTVVVRAGAKFPLDADRESTTSE